MAARAGKSSAKSFLAAKEYGGTQIPVPSPHIMFLESDDLLEAWNNAFENTLKESRPLEAEGGNFLFNTPSQNPNSRLQRSSLTLREDVVQAEADKIVFLEKTALKAWIYMDINSIIEIIGDAEAKKFFPFLHVFDIVDKTNRESIVNFFAKALDRNIYLLLFHLLFINKMHLMKKRKKQTHLWYCIILGTRQRV